MCCGWYKAELISFARTPPGKVAGGAGVHRAYPCVCRPEPYQPVYAARAADARNPAGGFNAFYHTWAAKNGLGPVRILNDISLMVTVYLVLTWCWRPLTGWQAGS
jgi:hypothetical protein